MLWITHILRMTFSNLECSEHFMVTLYLDLRMFAKYDIILFSFHVNVYILFINCHYFYRRK